MDDKLVPWQADRNALSNLSLTPSENALAREIHIPSSSATRWEVPPRTGKQQPR